MLLEGVTSRSSEWGGWVRLVKGRRCVASPPKVKRTHFGGASMTELVGNLRVARAPVQPPFQTVNRKAGIRQASGTVLRPSLKGEENEVWGASVLQQCYSASASLRLCPCRTDLAAVPPHESSSRQPVLFTQCVVPRDPRVLLHFSRC